MGFNYGIEKKKFNEEWKKLQKEYEEAGRSEKSIQEIYEFDLNVFRKNRTEINHTQPFTDDDCAEGNAQGESMSTLLQKFQSELSVIDSHNFQTNPRFSWIDEIENDELYMKVLALPEKDKELLTMIAFEGFTQREVAEIRKVAPAAICKKIKKLKKILFEG